MDLAALHAAVQALRARPGSHLAVLHSAEDPSDADPGLVRDARNDLDALCQSLIVLLASGWGDPLPLAPDGDLGYYLTQAYGWCVEGHWIAVGVSRHTEDRAGVIVAATGVLVSAG
jgi:hypothetical protein